jgi:alkylation response protein AidB-like acyl-CoA dehydrogenase
MDFTPTESQLEIRQLSEKIFRENVDTDRHRELEAIEGDDKYDARLWRTLGDVGLLGLSVKPDCGGMGMSFSELCIVIEEAGKVLAPIPLVVSSICTLALQKYGDAALQPVLASLATGQCCASPALIEWSPHQLETPTTQAQQIGDEWQLEGRKINVCYADNVDYFLVSASCEHQAGLFLVNAQQDGLEYEPLHSNTGEPLYALTLRNVKAAQKLGDAEALRYLVQHYTAALCSYQVGCLDSMLSMTSAYVAEREQFGVKVGTFQAVGHRAANCFIDLSCLRLVTQQAVSLLSEQRDADIAVRIAKCWAADAGHRVSYASQHLHGGIGADRDYGLWRYATHSKLVELTLGGAAMHLQALGQHLADGNINIE